MGTRPRWATLHPDNWTVLEVAEWLDNVAEEYELDPHVKRSLTQTFCDVDGRRLTAMTLQNFVDLDPHNGSFLYTVFNDVVNAGRLGHFGEQPGGHPRTLTPIRELDIRPGGQCQDHVPLDDTAPGPDQSRLSAVPAHRTPRSPSPCNNLRTGSQQQQQQQQPSSDRKPST